MIHILAELEIEDQNRFLTVFTTEGRRIRAKHGCVNTQLFRSTTSKVMFALFKWSSKADFESYLADPAVNETMESSGTVSAPKFTFMEELWQIPN
jgi:quinol monooxygenase YgiN